MTRRIPPTETVRMALTTLRSNRLRSLLTMVGIVIGNASTVITLVGVGRGAQGLAEEQLNNLERQRVVCGARQQRHPTARGRLPRKTLVLEDADAIAEQVPSVRRVARRSPAARLFEAGARTATSSISASRLIFCRSAVLKSLADGSSPTWTTRPHAVDGDRSDLRSKLFPTGDPLGQHSDRNAGLRSDRGDGAEGAVFGSNQDENAYIPLSAMVTRLAGRDPTYGISAQLYQRRGAG